MRPIDADAAKKDFGAHYGSVQDAICCGAKMGKEVLDV